MGRKVGLIVVNQSFAQRIKALFGWYWQVELYAQGQTDKPQSYHQYQLAPWKLERQWSDEKQPGDGQGRQE